MNPYIFLASMFFCAIAGSAAALGIGVWLVRNEPWDIRSIEWTPESLRYLMEFRNTMEQASQAMRRHEATLGIPLSIIEANLAPVRITMVEFVEVDRMKEKGA